VRAAHYKELEEMKKLLSTGYENDQRRAWRREILILTGRVDRRRGLPRVLGNLGLVLGEPGATVNGRVGAAGAGLADSLGGGASHVHRDLVGSSLGRGLTVDESLPRFIALVDDLDGVFLSLGFTVESKDVLP
jgi:hypothetical protein